MNVRRYIKSALPPISVKVQLATVICSVPSRYMAPLLKIDQSPVPGAIERFAEVPPRKVGSDCVKVMPSKTR